MARRKLNNNYTTICITWADKEEFRKFRQAFIYNEGSAFGFFARQISNKTLHVF